MKIVILGVGFLGSELINFFSKIFEVVGADINPRNTLIKQIDVTNRQEVENFLTNEAPEVVINTVALSSYFICENNPKLCRKLNFESTKNIAQICNKIGAKMIFISSSYVFNGEKGEYLETDEPNALNQYALSKIAAEKQVLELKQGVVIRLDVIYGFDKQRKQIVFGTNTFEYDVPIGFPNILKKPIFINDISPIILCLLEKNQSGIFHIAGLTKMKWLDFLTSLSVLVNTKNKIKIVDGSSWLLTPPNDSSLSVLKIITLGVKITSFNDSLEVLKHSLKF